MAIQQSNRKSLVPMICLFVVIMLVVYMLRKNPQRCYRFWALITRKNNQVNPNRPALDDDLYSAEGEALPEELHVSSEEYNVVPAGNENFTQFKTYASA